MDPNTRVSFLSLQAVWITGATVNRCGIIADAQVCGKHAESLCPSCGSPMCGECTHLQRVTIRLPEFIRQKLLVCVNCAKLTSVSRASLVFRRRSIEGACNREASKLKEGKGE